MVPRWLVAVGLMGPLLVLDTGLSQGSRLLQPEPGVLPRLADGGRVLGLSSVAFEVNPDTGLPEGALMTAFEALLRDPALPSCAVEVQVVGRVSADDLKGTDFLAAHRRAREHAVVVADALREAGVPSQNIRIGWDPSRPIAGAQVVLWMATPWDDAQCDRIRPGPAALVAVADAAHPLAKGPIAEPPKDPIATARADDPRSRVPKVTLPAVAKRSDVVPAAEVAALAPAKAAPAAVPEKRVETAALEPEPAPAALARDPASPAVQRKTEKKAAASPADTTPAKAKRKAPIEPAAGPEQFAMATIAEADPAREMMGGQALTMQFPINSSILDADQKAELAAAIAAAPGDQPLQVELVVAVGTGDVRGLDAEDALRYNRWLAQRRFARIENRLRDAARSRSVAVVPIWREGDPSRTVTVKLAPLS